MRRSLPWLRPLLAAAALGAAVSGCALLPPLPGGEGAQALPQDPPRRPGKPLVAVLLPPGPETGQALAGLRDEARDDFDLVTLAVDPGTTAADVQRLVERERPAALVLMNNPTVRLYQRWQATLPAGAPVPPALVLLTAFAEESCAGLRNVAGVSYEPPAVTSLAALRALLSRQVQKVGVVHRARFRRFIERQRAQVTRERFELVSAEVGDEPGPRELRRALDKLRAAGVDTIWVPDDDRLLRPELVAEAWAPWMEARPLPVVVGVASLVGAGDPPFGTFAVLPDHAALGAQAASLLFDLAARGWDASALGFADPLSVRSVLDVRRARARFGLRPEQLERVDLKVEEAR
jgi:hypothetical protein